MPSTCDSNNKNIHAAARREEEDAFHHVWDLPETVLFHIVSFVSPKTLRAHTLCHQLALLCHASYNSLLVDESRNKLLWEIVWNEEYCGGSTRSNSSQRDILAPPTRSCKRLRRTSLQKVQEAHQLVKNNTELCYFYLSELVNAATRKRALTLPKLLGLVQEYGPHLQLNSIVSNGGLFLVEVCRARNVTESTILKCVRYLVETHNVLINLSTNEPPSSLTALAVAGARGMPTIVRYLLSQGANVTIQSTGRFRLHHGAKKKTVHCIAATPMVFAQTMFNAEKTAGATERNLSGLASCIDLLRVVAVEEPE